MSGEELIGPGGYRRRIVRDEPDVLEMEAISAGTSFLPPEHLHPRQEERFEVLEGTMRTIVDGVERHYAAGEAFVVPPGTRHQMASEGPARMRWEVRPALCTAEFFRRLYSGEVSDFPAFFAEFADEIRLT